MKHQKTINKFLHKYFFIFKSLKKVFRFLFLFFTPIIIIIKMRKIKIQLKHHKSTFILLFLLFTNTNRVNNELFYNRYERKNKTEN